MYTDSKWKECQRWRERERERREISGMRESKENFPKETCESHKILYACHMLMSTLKPLQHEHSVILSFSARQRRLRLNASILTAIAKRHTHEHILIQSNAKMTVDWMPKIKRQREKEREIDRVRETEKTNRIFCKYNWNKLDNLFEILFASEFVQHFTFQSERHRRRRTHTHTHTALR